MKYPVSDGIVVGIGHDAYRREGAGIIMRIHYDRNNPLHQARIARVMAALLEPLPQPEGQVPTTEESE